MFCTNCGSNVADNANVCPNCGAALNPQANPAPNYAQPNQQYEQPVQQYTQPAQPTQDDGSVLTMGILAVALCAFGILGIIFGAIGKKKSNAFLSTSGALSPKAKVGRILSTVGLIIGIVMTVVWAIYIVVAIVAASTISYYY